MIKIIESDGFIERAVYHNGCVANYLLKLKPEKTSKNNDESVHDIAFSSLVSSIHGSDAALYAFSSISQQINLRSDRGIFSTE
jgi:hypothetical protein